MISSTLFDKLIQNEDIIKALVKLKFKVPTEVQAAAIEPMVAGKDIVVQAPTGTGKTAAFALPILEKIDPHNKAIQALILCPTRELALQIAGVIRELAAFMPKIGITTIYGGEPIQKQFAMLRKKPQIVVATPGRLIDHMNRKTINLSELNMLVLDEADRMLDMGFRPDLDKILSEVKKEKQTALFSATISKDIIQIAEKYQEDALNIKIAQKSLTVETVKQFYTVVQKNKKMSELVELFKKHHPKRSIIFVNTKSMSEKLTFSLKDVGYRATYLHGDMRQSARNKVIHFFKTGKMDVLIATDVAARGLDIDQVDMVINYDLPREQESYVHRIGRTGRAENRGVAYTIIYKQEQRDMDMFIRNLKADIKREPSLYSGGTPVVRQKNYDPDEKPREDRYKHKAGGRGRAPKRSFNDEKSGDDNTQKVKVAKKPKEYGDDKPKGEKKDYKSRDRRGGKKEYARDGEAKPREDKKDYRSSDRKEKPKDSEKSGKPYSGKKNHTSRDKKDSRDYSGKPKASKSGEKKDRTGSAKPKRKN